MVYAYFCLPFRKFFREKEKMIRVVGKVYPFKDNWWYGTTKGMWLIKKVTGFDTAGRAKVLSIGAFFEKEADAVEYCRWWNRKYFKEEK